MKMKFLIFFLIATINIGFSQDWNPFVFNQNSYYKQEHIGTIKVENFLLDSILSQGDEEVSYFNTQFDIKSECYPELNDNLKTFHYLYEENRIHSLIKRNDSIIFMIPTFSGVDSFIFMPYAQLNDSWISNGITIRCTALEALDIFGIQDSVKTFTCTGKGYDGIEFILSKNHGFIKFRPIFTFLFNPASPSPYYELIGFTNENVSVGYKQPDFSDYFHLSPGDVLFWENYIDDYDITHPPVIRYSVDTITAAFISPDSVRYDFIRTSYDKDWNISNTVNFYNYHLKKAEGRVVHNNTSWYGLMYNDFYPKAEIFYLESLTIKIENNDTITFADYESTSLIIDTSDCMVEFIADYSSFAGFSTKAGAVYYSNGFSSKTLIGSIINGVRYGDTEIKTSVGNIVTDNIKVYPNPFFDHLIIDSPNNLVAQIEIYDTIGNLILEKETYGERIDLKELGNGLYVLKYVDSKKKVRQTKIIKL